MKTIRILALTLLFILCTSVLLTACSVRPTTSGSKATTTTTTTTATTTKATPNYDNEVGAGDIFD